MSNNPSHPTEQTGLLVVIAAASGTGKSTVCRALIQSYEKATISVSYTTRAPRTGEVNGVHYHFVSKDIFQQMIQSGDLLEWAEVHGNFYGTGKTATEEQIAAGKDVLLDIDVQGAHAVREAFGTRAVLIFLLPPSWDEMVRRLRDRGTESEEAIARRLETARSELPAAESFDYLVINEEIDSTAHDVLAILRARRSAKAHMLHHLTAITDRMKTSLS